ncbi:MAG: glycosyltransferase [Candidatus Komeilibacteria bacterium]|nr:glycosyltransferase [Candidatus Komeilibacteria bacterium]
MGGKKLKILYFTQKVSADDNLLGTVYSWLNNLAGQVDQLYVICLEKGRVDLPANCQVFSLGKERGAGKFKLWLNFYRLTGAIIFKKKISGIFVHMNEIYLFLLLPFWPWLKILGKPIIWWKSHGHLSRLSKIANFIPQAIVTAANSSFNFSTGKKRVIGHGIDTSLFKPTANEPAQAGVKILAVGRIAPVKHYELLIEAVGNLVKQGITGIKAVILGEPMLAGDRQYYERLKTLINSRNLAESFEFKKMIPNYAMPALIGQFDFIVNPGGSNSLDKNVLEAAACAKPALDSNRAFKEILEPSELNQEQKNSLTFTAGSAIELTEKIKKLIALNYEQKNSIGSVLRKLVVERHDVNHLNRQIIKLFEELCQK